MKDTLRYKSIFRIARYASEEDRKNRIVYTREQAKALFGIRQFTEFERNLLLNEGINELWTLVCSSSGTKFDNTNAYLGVGNDNTAAQATDTGLIGASKLYKAMDGGFPTYGTSQKAVWKSTFGTADANFDWNEFTVANGNSDASKNLNRKVSAQGTKASGQTWELTLEITLS